MPGSLLSAQLLLWVFLTAGQRRFCMKLMGRREGKTSHTKLLPLHDLLLGARAARICKRLFKPRSMLV